MLSQSAPIFYGDIGSHERVITCMLQFWLWNLILLSWFKWNHYTTSHHEQVPILFSSFVEFCKKHLKNKGGSLDACLGPQRHDLAGSNTEYGSLNLEDVPERIYLAQVENLNFMKWWVLFLKESVVLDKYMQFQLFPFLNNVEKLFSYISLGFSSYLLLIYLRLIMPWFFNEI